MPTYTITYTKKIDDNRDVSIYPLSTGGFGVAYTNNGLETRLTLSPEALIKTKELIISLEEQGAFSVSDFEWKMEEE